MIRPHGFAGERHIVLPKREVEWATRRPVLRDLLVTAAGHFPRAAGHLVTRVRGLPDCILIFCADGSGWCRLAGRHWRLRAGQAILIPRAISHAYGSSKREPWSIYWAHFTGRRVQELQAFIGLGTREPLLTCGRPGEIADHFEELLGLLPYGHAAPNLFALAATFTQILSLLNVHRAAERTGARTSVDKVRGTVDFMRRNLARRLSVSDLARVAGLSAPHFTALFRRALGSPPMSFFMRMKIQEACGLLIHGEMRIHEVAARLGFEDPFYFSRTFSRVQGASPRTFRAMHRQCHPRQAAGTTSTGQPD